MKLNIGCGRNILPGWTNIDSVALPGVDIVTNLDSADGPPPLTHSGLPLASIRHDSVDEILCSHVLEHIRNILPLMEALWRYAVNGATMTVRVPYGSSDDAWEDPTHVRAFFLQSFGYFSQPYYWRADYGYRGDWQPERIVLIPRATGQMAESFFADVGSKRNVVSEMIATLRAVKPARAPLRESQRLPDVLMS